MDGMDRMDRMWLVFRSGAPEMLILSIPRILSGQSTLRSARRAIARSKLRRMIALPG